MKTKILTIAGIVFLAMLSQAVSAQISFYKVTGGTRTEWKPGDSTEIKVNDQNQAEENILVEVDLDAFKAKYKYDDFIVGYYLKIDPTREISYAHYNFNNLLVKKKYAGEKKISFYLFETEEIKANPLNIGIDSPKINPTQAGQEYMIRIWGRYVTGTKEYYTNQNTWEKADVYSEKEHILSSGIFTYAFSGNHLVESKYRDLVNPGEKYGHGGTGLQIISRELRDQIYRVKSFVTSIPVAGQIEQFKEVSRAIKYIQDERERQILEQTDKQKAIDLELLWSKDYRHLCVSYIGKEELKALNKDLKTVSEAEGMLEFFKKHNPRN